MRSSIKNSLSLQANASAPGVSGPGASAGRVEAVVVALEKLSFAEQLQVVGNANLLAGVATSTKSTIGWSHFLGVSTEPAWRCSETPNSRPYPRQAISRNFGYKSYF